MLYTFSEKNAIIPPKKKVAVETSGYTFHRKRVCISMFQILQSKQSCSSCGK